MSRFKSADTLRPYLFAYLAIFHYIYPAQNLVENLVLSRIEVEVMEFGHYWRE